MEVVSVSRDFIILWVVDLEITGFRCFDFWVSECLDLGFFGLSGF